MNKMRLTKKFFLYQFLYQFSLSVPKKSTIHEEDWYFLNNACVSEIIRATENVKRTSF